MTDHFDTPQVVLVSDLPETADTTTFLYCPECHTQSSATRGNYSYQSPFEPLTCEHCQDEDALYVPLVLARKEEARIMTQEAILAEHDRWDHLRNLWLNLSDAEQMELVDYALGMIDGFSKKVQG